MPSISEKRQHRKDDKDDLYGRSRDDLIKELKSLRDAHYLLSEAESRCRESEERLRKKEATLRRILEANPAATAIIQGEKIVFANPAMVRLFGYGREELYSMNYWDLVHPDFKEMVKDRGIRRQKGEDVPPRYQLRAIRKDGVALWIEVMATQAYYRESPASFLILVDITDGKQYEEELGRRVKERTRELESEIMERKRIEARLMKSETKYRELVQNANSIILKMDISGNITFFNEFAQQFFDYTENDILGKNVVGTIVPRTDTSGRDLEAMIKDIGLHTERYLTNENENMRRSGDRVWVSWTNKAITDTEGRAVGILCIGNDITDRKRMEEALRYNLHFLQALIDAIPNPIFYKDTRGVYLGCNKAFEKLMGLPRENIVGKTVYDIAPKDLAEIYAKMDDDLFKKGGVQSYESVVRYADGTRHPTIFYKAIVLKADGTMAGIVGTMLDITARKNAEDKLQKAYSELDDRVHERTAELAEANQALKEAKARAELYVDLMGHDINNMNQIGIGYLEMALETLKLDEKTRTLISKPLEVLTNSSRLIDNVRKIQRAKAGELRHKKVDLGKLLSEVRSDFLIVPGRKVEINLNAREGAYVMANELLKDVFSNLVGNAVKHSSGPLTIGIALTEAYLNGKKYYRVSIEDNGPGMPDEMKASVLSKKDSDRARIGGRGLGLYLVTVLVSGYGGGVSVEDRIPGDYKKGARFIVMLPEAEKAEKL